MSESQASSPKGVEAKASQQQQQQQAQPQDKQHKAQPHKQDASAGDDKKKTTKSSSSDGAAHKQQHVQQHKSTNSKKREGSASSNSAARGAGEGGRGKGSRGSQRANAEGKHGSPSSAASKGSEAKSRSGGGGSDSKDKSGKRGGGDTGGSGGGRGTYRKPPASGASGHPHGHTQRFSFLDDSRTKFLLVADPNGDLRSINVAVRRANAQYVICVGNLGFYDSKSRIPKQEAEARREAGKDPAGDFPAFLDGSQHFHVPVFAVYGDHGDMSVLNKLRTGEYRVPNLLMLDERATQSVGGVRFFGLGGRFRTRRLFDAGTSSVDSIAGSRESMWTTLLQAGELIDMADKLEHKERDSTRVLITFDSPTKHPYLTRLAQRIKAKVIISAAPFAPCSTAFFPFDVLPSAASSDLFSSSGKELKQMWQDVRDEVRKVADKDLLSTLALAVEIVDAPVPPVYLKSTLHINVSAAHFKSVGLLTAEGTEVGFAVAHFGVANAAKKRHFHESRSVQLVPAGAWQHLVTETDIRHLFEGLTVEMVEAPDAAKPIKVQFSHAQQAHRAAQVAAGKSLQDTPFRVVPMGGGKEHHHHRGRGSGGRGRGRGRSHRYDHHERR